MAYTALSSTDVQRWNDEYKQLSDDLRDETNPTARTLITNQMEALGDQVETSLNQVGQQVRAYYAQHIKKVDNWQRLSEKAITNARKAASAYKKDTSKGLPPQIQQAIDDITLWEKAISDDAEEFGAAWFRFRGNPAKDVPVKYKQDFEKVRSKVMEDQKKVTIIRTRLKGYIAEAQTLFKVTAKATMKAGIKAGTGTQRDIERAQDDAQELAENMRAQLDLLDTPRGLATQPAAISNAVGFLKTDSKNKGFTKNRDNQAVVTARKKTLESGIKLMRTQVANMEKLMATGLKGFRKNELADATVKAQIKLAQEQLKSAHKKLKTKEGEVKKGKEYINTIEARWKKQK